MKSTFSNYPKAITVFLLTLFTIPVFCQTPEINIDFNMFGRPAREVNELNHTSWIVTNGGPDSITVNGIKFVVKKGKRGNALSATWWKEGVQSPITARLVRGP